MHELFDLHSNDGWGLLLVDTCNAFNSSSVDLIAASWNARVLWPQYSCFLFNSYQGYPGLYI